MLVPTCVQQLFQLRFALLIGKKVKNNLIVVTGYTFHNHISYTSYSRASILRRYHSHAEVYSQFCEELTVSCEN